MDIGTPTKRHMKDPPRWTVRHALITALVSVVAFVLVRWITHPSLIDLAVYRAEGTAVRNGMDLYGPLPTPNGLRATYPPFAALLFVPFSYLPWLVVATIGVVGNLALLLLVCDQSCRLAGVAPSGRITAALTLAAVALWAEPVFTTFRYGQINLVILALVLWDFRQPDNSRLRGIGVGLATAIKLTPGIFVVYLVLTRRFRMALNAVLAFALTIGFSAAILPSETWKYWTRLVWDTGRVGRLENAANQSIRGLIVRVEHTRATEAAWSLLLLVVIVAGLGCAAYAYRQLGDSWGLPTCALTGLVAAPIAWTHHWVWCVPITVLLWQHRRRWLPLIIVFWTFAVWAVPHMAPAELHFAPWQTALSGWYVLVGVIFIGLTATVARQVAQRRAADVPHAS